MVGNLAMQRQYINQNGCVGKIPYDVLRVVFPSVKTRSVDRSPRATPPHAVRYSFSYTLFTSKDETNVYNRITRGVHLN